MRAVAMVLRARLRQYWTSWLALSVLVAVIGGFVLAAAVTGRRTAAAFPGFVARHGYDVVVYAGHPLPQLPALPQVAHVTAALLPFSGPPRCASCNKQIVYSDFGVFEVAPPGLTRMVKLLSGRMPDQSDPHEALASYTLARDNGVRIGSVIEAPTLSKAQQAELNPGRPPRVGKGPRLILRVVGIVATENEFPAGSGVRYDLFPSAAFAAAVNQRVGLLPVYFLRLRHGVGDLPAVDSWLRSQRVIGTDAADTDAAAVQRDIRPQAVGWWVLAGLAALAGLAVIGQAIARQSATEGADHRALSAVGLGFRELVLVAMARAVIIGAAGAAGAVAVATLLSPLTPVGEARLAAAGAGELTFDPLILPLGALVTVAAVAALAVTPAVRSARLLRGVPPPQAGPARLVSAVATAGAPPSALIGIRNALERRRGGQQVPVGTALLGTVMAVAALCATAVFGASLTHLLSSPALYGLPYQVSFSNLGPGSGAAVTGPVLTSLRRDRAIQRISLATTEQITVNGSQVGLLAVTPVRGPALISAVDGRLPERDKEIALGAATMRATGARPGGLVRVAVTDAAGTPHRASFRVVGRASFPISSGTGGLGSGATMTVGALIDAQCPPGHGQPACQRAARRGIVWDVLVRSAPGPAGSRRWPGMSAPTASTSPSPASRPNWSTSARRSISRCCSASCCRCSAPRPWAICCWSAWPGGAARPACSRCSVLSATRSPRRSAGRLRPSRCSGSWSACRWASPSASSSGVRSPRTSAWYRWRWCSHCCWWRSRPRCWPRRTCSPSSRRCWPRGHARVRCCGPSERHRKSR